MWWGKFFGSVMGFMSGGPFGAAFGIWLGDKFDQTMQPFTPGWRFSFNHHDSARTLNSLFRILGGISRSMEAHKDDAQTVLAARAMSLAHFLDLDATRQKRSREAFFRGAARDFDLATEARAFRQANRFHPYNIALLLNLSIQVAISEGDPGPATRNALETLRQGLGISHSEFEFIFQEILKARHQQGHSQKHSLSDAYRILGISENANAQQIKQAYRRLMNQFHPDKLTARGAPINEVERAKVTAQQIQQAYAQIKSALKAV
ncbi:DnaJ-domain-containing protein 1 [Hahella chejuensis KCTC 2396]|uniref:DnaJ-domain-containing protein 1 n=1 Tax=Hahella chejuensis (strain KCTC 2396) TaxID=349521 RepID=Q2S9B6_HAHCH|nr:co-chaperone DjlA [Hahella chejuensis]ABC32758.1 DnaJ-domain-containing protein 1 [Hahella chejuensis KCTC 2396]